MPTLTPSDQLVLHISTLTKAEIQVYNASRCRNPFPMATILSQIVSDRLTLSGDHLRAGDQLVRQGHFRSAISRHYYAMYHAARAIVFFEHKGDDYERHRDLPRNLPSGMPDVERCEVELTEARLLRNQADYDIYPTNVGDWDADARTLAAKAAQFVSSFENYALMNGYV